MYNSKRAMWVLVALLAVSFALAGCSGDEGSGGGEDTGKSVEMDGSSGSDASDTSQTVSDAASDTSSDTGMNASDGVTDSTTDDAADSTGMADGGGDTGGVQDTSGGSDASDAADTGTGEDTGEDTGHADVADTAGGPDALSLADTGKPDTATTPDAKHVTCPRPSQSGGVCLPAIHCCVHQPTGTTCRYSSSCKVPMKLKNDGDWKCGAGQCSP